MKTLLMGFIVLLTVSCNCFAEETFILKAETEDTSKDFLEMFNEEEKCIILAFESQLQSFATIYSYHHKGPMGNIGSSVSLWDVGSLYYNSKEKTLEGFLDYICKPMLEKAANTEINIEMFKDRIMKDYEFVKHQREREKEENEFFNLLFGVYQKLLSEPKAREYFRVIERKVNEY